MIDQKIKDIAKDYNIPHSQLTVTESRDMARQKDIITISFKSKYSMDKYSGELAYNSNGSAQLDVLELQIKRLLERLEEKWLEEGGNVTYYKGQAFFWRHFLDDNSTLEVECCVCGEVVGVSKPAKILDEYRDVYLMNILPKAAEKCECDNRKI